MPANKAKLTDAFVARTTLPSGVSEMVFWDTEVAGFGLRLRSTSKTWIVMYRPAGAGRSVNARRLKLGTVGAIDTAAEARRLARIQFGRIAQGLDPAVERAELKRKEKARLEDLLARYDAFNERRGYVDRKGTMSTLQRNLKPLLNRDVKTIEGAEIVAIRNALVDAGLEGAALNFWSRCRAFFSWCLNVEKVRSDNPVYAHRVEKPTRAEKITKEEHGRALSDEELAKVWSACDSASVFGRYVRFLILSGCRRTEAARAGRSMLATDKAGRRLMVFPKAITKSGRDHNVPVTDLMWMTFERCIVDERHPDFLFPSWRTGRPMAGWSDLLAPLVTRSGVDFDLHDIRRTFRTGLDRLGVSSDVAEICINHGRRGLEAVYNRNGAGNEMRDAFELWSNHIQTLGVF